MCCRGVDQNTKLSKLFYGARANEVVVLVAAMGVVIAVCGEQVVNGVTAWTTLDSLVWTPE